MRLKYNKKSSFQNCISRLHRSRYFVRMMSIIRYTFCTVKFAQIFKPPLNSDKISKSFSYFIKRKAENSRNGNCGKRVQNIVFAVNIEFNFSQINSTVQHRKRIKTIIANYFMSAEISIIIKPESYTVHTQITVRTYTITSRFGKSKICFA